MDDEITFPRTVDGVFKDYLRRRRGVLKALSTDFDAFYSQCDPEKENLCLYGLPNEEWELNTPTEFVPASIPEPAIGINFSRDEMLPRDWLLYIAHHSDVWLIAVAYFFGFLFNQAERMRLFNMINVIPTLVDQLTEETTRMTLQGRSLIFSWISKPSATSNKKQDLGPCGVCGQKYVVGQYYIRCDLCNLRYHGDCVRVTKDEGKDTRHYACPFHRNRTKKIHYLNGR